MRVNRSMFVGMFALVAAIGMLGVNGYFWWMAQSEESRSAHASTKSGPQWPIIREPELSAESAEDEVWVSPYRIDYDEAEAFPTTPKEHTQQFFPHPTESIDLAQVGGEDVLPPIDQPPPPAPPRLLPDVDHSDEQAWLKELIRQELPNASAEEQQVWLQELQGLDAEMVRGILRMKKQLAANPTASGMPKLGPGWHEEPPVFADSPLVPPPADLPSDAHSVANRLQPSLAALEQARDVILNNLANTHTVGFKRSRVVLAPMPYQTIQERVALSDSPRTPAAAVSVGWGIELASTPLDETPGTLRKTDQPLDVAIDGPGFFLIRDGENILYTRCGLWAVNEEGLLCLMSGNKLKPIEPALAIPAKAVSIVIAETGEVSALEPGSDAPVTHNMGTIQLTRFPNAGGLKPRGGHLLSATPACGTPQTGSPQQEGFGIIRQGMLEQSNVSRDEELEEFQKIHTHWQMLKHLASTSDRSPLPGPVARQPAGRTQRTSATTSVPIAPPTLEQLKELRGLLENCLPNEQINTLKRRLGLEPPEDQRNPDEWFKKYFMSEKARQIERNLGFDD